MTKRILLADDDAGVRQMLKRVLELERYDVVTAGTGAEAAAKFRAHAPDLVLLDLNMPGKDGWEAFDLMNDTHPFVPVIVITAKPRQYERAVAAGVDALMEKPLDLPLLLATIAGLLAESEAERVRRLTNRDFKTVFLTQTDEACSKRAG
jgi:CheY-like chemotaxis protein